MNKRFFLALNRMPQVGPRTVAKLLRRWPNLQELFELPLSQLEQLGVPTSLAMKITTFDFRQLDLDWRWLEEEKHVILTWEDALYPSLLKEIHDAPPVLYAKGDVSSLNQPMLAMVGTRNPSVTGSETARRFAFELSAKKITIVSGLALGIDAEAHRGCIDAQGKTIAVMGTGIDCIYPRRHLKLAEQITENGLLLSELPLQSPPIAGHFPRRNRIISGLSLCTLVVEAAIKSGSLITARMALEQNRDVLAIPGSIYNPQVRGCHHLLQQGAKVVICSDDVLEELQIERELTATEITPVLASENKNLVKCIGFEVTRVDQIILRSGLTVDKVVSELACLELKGIVKAVPGGYMRCTV